MHLMRMELPKVIKLLKLNDSIKYKINYSEFAIKNILTGNSTHMKKHFYLTIVLICFITNIHAQNITKVALVGFDSLQINITHGNIDSIYYYSETVGVKRKTLIYTPPGYSKNNSYPVLYLLHGIGGDEYEWLKGAHPEVILDNLYAENKIEPMIVVMPNGRAMKDDRADGNIDYQE